PPPRSTLFPYTTLFRSSGVSLREATTGQLLRELSAEGQQISTVAYSPDSRLLAIGSDQRGGAGAPAGCVQLWNVATGNPVGKTEDRKSTRLNSSHRTIS